MTPSPAPRVTVGISFYNEERYLAAAIASILAQTFADFELLLVDDGSTDGSLAIARSFRDPRITVTSDGVRRHLPARLNEIAARASGELVARMDADDVVHPTRIARQVAILDQDPSVDAVGTWVALVDDAGVILGVGEFEAEPKDPRVALRRGLIAHATMVARRSWLLAHAYDERSRRAEDRDLWCRTVKSSRFVVVPEVLYVIRVAPRGREFLRDYLDSQRQNRRLFAKHGPSLVGVKESARLWGLSYAKGVVMRAAVATGLAHRLVQGRGRPPTATERAMIEESLRGQRA